MTHQANTLRKLTSSELDHVGGGAAPGQGVDPNAPPAGTDPQPLNPVGALVTAAGTAATLPGTLPGTVATIAASLGHNGGLL